MAKGVALEKQLQRLCESGIENRAELARRCGVSLSTINVHLPARFKRKGRYTTAKPIRLSVREKAVIEGGVLGDGRLAKHPASTNFLFSNNHEDLVRWIARQLPRLVVTSRNYRYTNASPIFQSGSHFIFRTSSFQDLNTLWERWYAPVDDQTRRTQPWRYFRKAIPSNFRLTPLAALVWYLGDGSLVRKTSRDLSQTVRLATHDLPKPGITKVLIPQISTILDAKISDVVVNRDRRSRYKEYGFEIYIPSRYVSRWLSYIGKCPVSSYRYKWDWKPTLRKMWRKDELELLRRYWGRVEHEKICTALNVTFEQARKAAKNHWGFARSYSRSGVPLKRDPRLASQLIRDARGIVA
jgi:hypothetical protein